MYKIVDTRNNQIVYIGKTNNFDNRKSNHFSQDKQHVDKYMLDEGRSNFEMTIIQDNIETNDEAIRLEDSYITEYQPLMNKQRSGNVFNDDPKQYMKDYKREYEKTDKRRKYIREYQKSEKWKDYQREYQRQYYHRKKTEKQNSNQVIK